MTPLPAARSRLHETFAALCRIPSPFGHERACADAVAALLGELGLEPEEDDAAAAAGAECGNLLARIPAPPGRSSVLLCAHLDTVRHELPVEPVLVDDGWENANDAILGADNKAAVAVVLEAARECVERGAPVGVELLFTVSEENSLAGAKAFDVGRLQSAYGFVFDHASPIGEVVMASPTLHRLDAELRGVAAHAGIRPEAGRSAIAAAAHAIAAMRLGRLDDETTANIGRIAGGTGINVVAERCRVEGEARSLDDAKVEAAVTDMVDRLHDGANAVHVDLDIAVERLFQAYRHRPDAPQVVVAEAALRRCGHAPRRIVTGGASDANAFEAVGFPCTNLANGTERNHEPTERVSVAALEGMLDVTRALLDEAAAAC